MAIVKTNPQRYADIAAAIRTRLGTAVRYTPGEMPEAIMEIAGAAVGSVDSSKVFAVPVSAAYVLTDDQFYGAIADAIRAKNGTSATYKPGGMQAAILAIAAGYRITVNLPSGMEDKIEVEYLSGSTSMQMGETLSVRITSKQAGYVLNKPTTATMGGSSVDLSGYVTTGIVTGGQCKTFTISGLTVTGDFVLNVTGDSNFKHCLIMTEAINGTGAGDAFRQPGGFLRPTFTPADSTYGITNGSWSMSNNVPNTDQITFWNLNTGEQLEATQCASSIALSVSGGKYFVQISSIKLVDFKVRVEFRKI